MAEQHFGKWLKAEIERLLKTQPEFAADAGIEYRTVRNWIQTKSPNIRGVNLEKLAKALGVSRVSIEERLGRNSLKSELDRNVSPVDLDSVTPRGLMRDVPILNRIPAGCFQDERQNGFSAVYEGGWTKAAVGEAPAFALWVEGDSMEPRYRNGDLVVFKVVDPERHQIIEGGDYAIQLSGEEFYEQSFKQLFNDPKDGPFIVIAKPINPKVKPKQVKISRMRISRLGLVFMVYPRMG